MKKKILLVNQSSKLKTGYGVMGYELLTRLSKDYEVAELASDLAPNDPYIQQADWKIYPVLPLEHEQADFNSSPLNTFGRWKFGNAICDFRPTHVISWRDHWMDKFIGQSPYKKYFKWLYMPTVDAEGQSKDWLADYMLADKLFVYQEWSRELLKKESGGRLDPEVCTPSTAIFKMEQSKEELQQTVGLTGPVIGTVMRNQGRKRFPEFFQMVARLVETHPTLSVITHTAYPDKMGWNIPKLLLENNVYNHVYFTYTCQMCKQVFPSVYKGKLIFCPKCNMHSGVMVTSGNALDNNQMSLLYNLMDLYVQYASNEGLGIPLIEAASAGTPFIAPNYSGMQAVISNLHGIPVKILTKNQEIESDRLMSVTDQNDMVNKINQFLSLTKEQQKVMGDASHRASADYSWDKFTEKFRESVDSLPAVDYNTARDIRPIPSWDDRLSQMPPSQFVRWCIVNVLQDKQYINSHYETKLIDELNSTIRHLGHQIINVDRRLIFDEICQHRAFINNCESRL